MILLQVIAALISPGRKRLTTLGLEHPSHDQRPQTVPPLPSPGPPTRPTTILPPPPIQLLPRANPLRKLQ